METKNHIEQLELFSSLMAKTKQRKKLLVDRNQFDKSPTLFHKFKQLARVIYHSYLWDDEQILKAARILYPYIDFKTCASQKNRKVIETRFVSDKTQMKLKLFGKSDQTYCRSIYYKLEGNQYYKRFLILSDAKELVAHYTDTYYRCNKPFVRYSYISKEYLLGYAYLISNIKAKMYGKDAQWISLINFELKDVFKGLIAGTRSKNYAYYDYVLAHLNIADKRQQEIVRDYKLMQELYLSIGKENKLVRWNGLVSYKQLIDYIHNFLDSNFIVVPTKRSLIPKPKERAFF